MDCPHNLSHILSFVVTLLKMPKDAKGCIVEAGCFKGGSAAKFSLIAKYLGRELIIFDSFEGLLDNSEDHNRSIYGHSIKGWFKEKEFCGSMEEVKNNIEQYEDISVFRFVKGGG